MNRQVEGENAEKHKHNVTRASEGESVHERARERERVESTPWATVPTQLHTMVSKIHSWK
jgi:hypothetical protein